jgi:RNA polymerase sigma-32 factor
MGQLDIRERHILSQRKLIDTPLTLDELSKEYGISRERVRQIEVRAFEKLQKHIKELAINNNLWPE